MKQCRYEEHKIESWDKKIPRYKIEKYRAKFKSSHYDSHDQSLTRYQIVGFCKNFCRRT